MRFQFIFLSVFLALVVYSCTHSIHLVNVSDFKPYTSLEGDNDVIKSESIQSVIMGLKFDTNYVDEAYENLLSQCPTGNIKGITLRYSTSHGFFSWKNKVIMQGLYARTN